MTLQAKISDSQPYPWNLYLISNLEYILYFYLLDFKVFNLDNYDMYLPAVVEMLKSAWRETPIENN